MSKPGDAEEFANSANKLWIDPSWPKWMATDTGYKAQMAVSGAPSCRLVVTVPNRPWPAGNLSLLWNSTRVRGLDLSGSAHLHRGTRVDTPHKQFFDGNGEGVAESIDLDAEAISGLETAVRWFLKWSGIEWHSAWREPPLQADLRSIRQTQAARPPKRAARRKKR